MLDGIRALVTGASQGIGREIATTFGEEGADVALAARSDGIYETAELLPDEVTALPVETDVTDESSVASTIDEVTTAFGGLDCLVNNAGIAGPTAPVEEVDREDFDRTMAVNVTGVFLMTKHASAPLRQSDQGSIINISSISGKRPLINRTPYVASKTALTGLTRTHAFEFGDDEVTVNMICPGPTNGPRIDGVIERQAEDWGVDFETAKERLYTNDAAMNRLVDREDTADMAVFLASDRARHITAQDYNVDAGMSWY